MNLLLLAYLDPSSGSLAYQVLISGLLAAAAAVRLYWHKLRDIFAGHGEAVKRTPSHTRP